MNNRKVIQALVAMVRWSHMNRKTIAILFSTLVAVVGVETATDETFISNSLNQATTSVVNSVKKIVNA